MKKQHFQWIGIVILIAIAMVANNIVALVSNRLTRWRA